MASAQVLAQNPLSSIFKGGIDDGVGIGVSIIQNAFPDIYNGGQEDGVAVAISLNQNKSDALPISILAFTGSWFNDDPILDWEVAEQKNLNHFELERSDNEGKIFSNIYPTEPNVSNLY